MQYGHSLARSTGRRCLGTLGHRNAYKKFPPEAIRRQRPRGRAGSSAAVLCGPVLTSFTHSQSSNRRSHRGFGRDEQTETTEVTLLSPIACSVFT